MNHDSTANGKCLFKAGVKCVCNWTLAEVISTQSQNKAPHGVVWCPRYIPIPIYGYQPRQ